ncbi:MAG: CBU_0592 family membrane protein [Gemmatimonadaceae bacterium]
MFYQLISVAGAVMVLFGYVGYQRGMFGREDRLYSFLNFAGSALLAWVAIIDQRWGFIVLEVVWALVSLPALIAPPQRKAASTD